MRELAFGAVYGALSMIAIVAIYAWPIPGRPVASIFPGSFDGARAVGAVARADGLILWQQPGGSTTISIADSAGYVGALYAAGAWLVIDAEAAKWCLGLGRELKV